MLDYVACGEVMGVFCLMTTGEVKSVAFSPNGNCVVSGSNDNPVKIWDTETGAEVSSFVEWSSVC